MDAEFSFSVTEDVVQRNLDEYLDSAVKEYRKEGKISDTTIAKIIGKKPVQTDDSFFSDMVYRSLMTAYHFTREKVLTTIRGAAISLT